MTDESIEINVLRLENANLLSRCEKAESLANSRGIDYQHSDENFRNYAEDMGKKLTAMQSDLSEARAALAELRQCKYWKNYDCPGCKERIEALVVHDKL